MTRKTMFIIGIIFIVIAIALFVGWSVVMSRPNPPLPGSVVTIGSATFSVELATTSIAQARGLSLTAEDLILRTAGDWASDQ